MRRSARILLATVMLLNMTHLIFADEPAESNPLSPSDKFYHYSIWGAFVNRIFEGDLTVKEMKAQGDLGLGSYTKLIGEMVMLDGIPYMIDEQGVVTVPPDDKKLVYVNATFFDNDLSFEIPQVPNYEELRKIIKAQLPSKNYFYAFKVHGSFENMKLGGVPPQEPPFTKGLDELLPIRPIFHKDQVDGTLVGFYCPAFIGDINVEGFHFHFISDDHTFGGHALEFSAKDLHVEIDRITEYQFVVPSSPEFENVEFEKSFQYQMK